LCVLLLVYGGLHPLSFAVIANNVLARTITHVTEAQYQNLATWLRQRLFMRLPKVADLMENSKK